MHELFTLQSNDWQKGLITAILSAIFGLLYQQLTDGFGAFDWKQLLLVGILGGLGYITKNFFTNSSGEFGKLEPK